MYKLTKHNLLFNKIKKISDEEKHKLSLKTHKYSKKGIKNILNEKEFNSYLNESNNSILKCITKKHKFTFIDLFAGIGGFRIALQNLGGKCIFTSEWDKKSQETYFHNFGNLPFGNIQEERTRNAIPKEFDILCAGFPCQAFSIAGKRGGFEDARGTLFFDVAEIIKKHRPRAIFLENVKGLVNHKSGKTLETILNILRNDLNYIVPNPEIVNAKNFGIPQNRERIFIVGFRKEDYNKKEIYFNYPKPLENTYPVKDILEPNKIPTKYYLSNQYLNTLIKHKERHIKKGNGFGYEIIDNNKTANTILVGGMGLEKNLIKDKGPKNYTPTTQIKSEVNKKGIRKMTPREWARLQGFPDNYEFPVANVHAYKQLGNSVAIPAIRETAKKIIKIIQ